MSQDSQDNLQVTVRGHATAAAWRKEPVSSPPLGHSWRTAGRVGGRVSASSSHRIAVGALFATFVGLTSYLVYELLLLPARTTLIAAVADDYRWPLPPNAWAREDVDALTIGLGDQTLSIRDLPLAGMSADKALVKFQAQFDRAIRQTRRNATVLVYVSGHGVVDREGHPCLLLPAADPLDSTTWLKVGDLLAHMKSANRRERVRWLLVLDANRQAENWNIGLLRNTFAEGLARAVAEAGDRNVAVLNSTSPGEVGWTSLHLRGSVFGHFLKLGLAGAADENGDRQVSLHELVRYVKRNVDAWTCKHRAVHQTPVLYPPDTGDSAIAWSMNPKDLAVLTAPVAKPSLAEESAAGNKLAALWLAHDRLESLHADHFAPGTWPELEYNLVWLEQAATSGAAGRIAREAMLPRLQTRLDAAAKLVTAAAGTGRNGIAPIEFSAVLSGDTTLPLQQIKAYSLPLSEYLGMKSRGNPELFSEAELARIFQHYGTARLWPSSDIPSRAIALNRLGQQLAVPQASDKAAADQRAHALVRPMLNEADQVRRISEDSVLLGPAEAPEIKATFDRATNLYDAIRALEADLARSYQVRDQAWSELPCLAQWTASQGESGDAVSAATTVKAAAPPRAAKEKVTALIEAAQRLDESLHRVERAGLGDAGKRASLAVVSRPAIAAAREVAELLDTLHNHLHDAARRLPLAASTPKTLCEISALLSMPMVSGKVRTDLYSHYLQVAKDVDDDTGLPATPGASANASEAQAILPETPSETHWPVHPITALLGVADKPAVNDAQANLLALGDDLRSALRGKPAADPTVDSGPAVERDSERASTSLDLLDAERPLRRLVALRGARQADAFRWIEHRHLQDLLLWHGQRVLDDFWGTTQAGQQHYFAAVAEAYVAGVRLVAHPDADVEKALLRMQSALDQRLDAAARGLATTSTDLILIDQESAVTAQVGVRQTGAAVGLPSGIAAVYLRDDNSVVPQTTRRLEVRPGAAGTDDGMRTVAISVPGRELTGRKSAMQAVAMFRGHEFPAPIMQRGIRGPTVEVRRQDARTSRITMRGSLLKRASVVFILDCSHSMADPVPVESPDTSSRNPQMSKMNVAINTMQGMMERLGEQGDVRVGVRFFGHRAGWRTDQTGVLVRQENYPGGVPATLRPYEDIELFLPLGRFDSIAAGNVNRRLQALKPWGESPIFHSLMEALKDFGPEDAGTERRVVVITDGMNYQFNPPPEAAPSLKDVETAYAAQGIGVDVVGFGIPEEERSAAVRDFTQLARSSNGSFTLATNASALIHRLDQLLVKTRFHVLDYAGRALGEADLGGTINIEPQGATPQPYTIEVEKLRTTTRLLGGESLQLAIGREGGKIISLPYEEEGPVFVPLVTADASPSGYRLGVHRRSRDSESVVFPISFQREDGGIPLPPAQVWMEITPIQQGRRMATLAYVFYDENFEPGMPVPLMRCRCRDWPQAADQAEVHVWCREEAVTPFEIVPLSKVANRAPPAGDGFELSSMPGVRYQVRKLGQTKAGDPMQVRVVQRYKPGIPANSVGLAISGPADRITHQYDWDRGIVMHHFQFDARSSSAAPPTDLRFYSREQVTSAAWHMAQPIVVEIGKHTEVVLPPRQLDPALPAGRLP
jgi:hypothetical protein